MIVWGRAWQGKGERKKRDIEERGRRGIRASGERERGGANRLDVNRIQSFKGRASLKRKRRREDSDRPKPLSKVVDLGTEPLTVADLADKVPADLCLAS